LLLNVAMQTRILRSIVIECIQLPADNCFITEFKKTTGAWTTRVQGLQEKEEKTRQQIEAEVGLCHCHGWNSLIKALMTHFQTHTLNDKLASVKSYVDKINTIPTLQEKMTYLMTAVNYCRVAKTHDSKFKRLEIGFGMDESEERVIYREFLKPTLLLQEKSRLLKGIAPPGDLERQIQKWIDKHNTQ